MRCHRPLDAAIRPARPALRADQHCMVTGANQGLGYETSLELARRGAVLYMVGG